MSYKLMYFPARARGECCRLVLAASGKKWEDCRITFEQWPAEKPKTPFGGMPVLEVNGKKYGQSSALEIFLAKEFGLAGKTNLDLLRAMEVVNLKEDCIQTLAKAKFEKDEAKKKELEKKNVEEDIPRFLGIFEKLLKENGGSGFFVGSSLSVADLAVYDICDTMLAINAKALDSCPEVKKLRAKVEANANVKAYIDKRPKSDF